MTIHCTDWHHDGDGNVVVQHPDGTATSCSTDCMPEPLGNIPLIDGDWQYLSGNVSIKLPNGDCFILPAHLFAHAKSAEPLTQTTTGDAPAPESQLPREPRAVLDAMVPAQGVVAGLALRPVTLATALILQRIGSTMLEAGEGGSYTLSEIVRVLYVLTHDPAECRRLVGAGGFDAAVETFADTLPLANIGNVAAALAAHLSAAFATAVPYGRKEDGQSASPFPVSPSPGQPVGTSDG